MGFEFPSLATTRNNQMPGASASPLVLAGSAVWEQGGRLEIDAWEPTRLSEALPYSVDPACRPANSLQKARAIEVAGNRPAYCYCLPGVDHEMI